jgi:hypothetical protein
MRDVYGTFASLKKSSGGLKGLKVPGSRLEVPGFRFEVPGFRFEVPGCATMKIIRNSLLLLFSLSLMAYLPVKTGDTKVKVNGTVIRYGVYCGGAEPSEEQLAEIQKPQPWSTKKLFVKKGKVNDLSAPVLLEFTTDKEGKFSIDLPPGDYCIVDEYKVKKSNYTGMLKTYKEPTELYGAVDKKCLETYFKTPELVFTVSDGMKDLQVVFHDRCSWLGPPCVEYKGSPPP